MANENKKYNKTIAPLWKSKFGGFYTYVKDEAYDALQGVEKGGMLLIREVKEASRTKETSPHAYLEYASKADIAAGKGRAAAGKSSDDL